MTEKEKRTILEMRAEGITYKAIAEQMGTTIRYWLLSYDSRVLVYDAGLLPYDTRLLAYDSHFIVYQ